MLALVWFVLSSPLSTAKASDTFVFTAIPDEDESGYVNASIKWLFIWKTN